MNAELLRRLCRHTEEEEEVLAGRGDEVLARYTDSDDTIRFRDLLPDGKLLAVRTHTRFLAFPSHRHNYIEIIYMCKGTTTHVLDGSVRLTLGEGELLFLNQHAFHSVERAGEGDVAVNVVVRPEFFSVALGMMAEDSELKNFLVGTLTGRAQTSSYLHFRTADEIPVRNLVENLVLHAQNGDEDGAVCRFTMGLLFLELLSHTDKLSSAGEGAYEKKLVASVLRYIEDEYPEATLTEIAARLNQSLSALSRLITRVTGKNFRALLAERRMRAAEKLFAETDLPVTDVIHGVGYENTGYFHREFLRRHGMTPRAYRAECVKIRS